MKAIKNGLKKLFDLQDRASKMVAINKRNLLFIYPNNARTDYPLADDKLQTKKLLDAAGIPTPRTFYVFSYFYQLEKLASELSQYAEFVIKPAHGRAGGGILVIVGRDGDDWLSITGKRYSTDELKYHITEIIFGVYSFDMKDHAIIEERIIQNDDINALSPYGLSDIRLILYRNEPVMAMARLPTVASGGRANIHQGAIGVGIDLDTGLTNHALHQNQEIDNHPDTGMALIDKAIPFWHEIIAIGCAAAGAIPLKYIGADIAVTVTGPTIIELNVRPGLAIQSANNSSLLERLNAIGGIS